MLVREAEAHAERSGGWTTARHHAVPTTDIPLHLVPTLLAWFKSALANTLAPMLARHFGSVVKSASDIRVHDAFLVRYAAGKQQHLPLHTDESQISLTIVLNEGFRGGGTYFADLRRAISPSVGHVIAFEGHALHGGEPIVQGTRYIIAAFLHVVEGEGVAERDEAGGSSTTAGKKKRTHDTAMRGDTMAAEEDGGPSSWASTSGGGSFSFGF